MGKDYKRGNQDYRKDYRRGDGVEGKDSIAPTNQLIENIDLDELDKKVKERSAKIESGELKPFSRSNSEKPKRQSAWKYFHKWSKGKPYEDIPENDYDPGQSESIEEMLARQKKENENDRRSFWVFLPFGMISFILWIALILSGAPIRAIFWVSIMLYGATFWLFSQIRDKIDKDLHWKDISRNIFNKCNSKVRNLVTSEIFVVIVVTALVVALIGVAKVLWW